MLDCIVLFESCEQLCITDCTGGSSAVNGVANQIKSRSEQLVSAVWWKSIVVCRRSGSLRPGWIKEDISVQVNIVAVSDHVFHRFPFDLLIQMSATQLSLSLCIPFVFMAYDRTFEDAIHTSLSGSPAQLSSNVGSPYGSAPDLERTVSRSTTMEEKSTKSLTATAFLAKHVQN